MSSNMQTDTSETISNPSESDSLGIVFTLAAAEKVASLIAEENNPNLNLRVAINGGGCSGFQYAFSFDESIQEDDAVVVQRCSDGHPVKLLIDYISYQYLSNAEIDYINSIQGEQFIIRNPNAKTTCGCGSSFSMDDEDDMGEDDMKDV